MPGYKLDILIDAKTFTQIHLLCCACKFLLRIAVQSMCGHRFCESCIQDVLRCAAGQQARCPVCPQDSEDGILNEKQIYPDFHARKELQLLQVKCCNRGCQWKGNLQEYTKHESSCMMETIRCPNVGCSKNLLRSAMEQHLEKDCPMRTITCRHCGDEIQHKQLKKHPYVCPKAKVACDDCGRKMARDLLSGHRGECPNKAQGCPYEQYGCNFKAPGSSMDDHMQSQLIYHTQLQVDKFEMHIAEWRRRLDEQEARLGIHHPDHADSVSASGGFAQGTLEEGEACAGPIDDRTTTGGEVQDTPMDYLVSLLKPMFVLKGGEQNRREADKTIKIEAEQRRKIPKSAASQKLENTIRTLQDKCNESGQELSMLQTLYGVLGQRNDTFQEVVIVLNAQLEEQLSKLNKLSQNYQHLQRSLDERERRLSAQDQLLTMDSVALADQDIRLQALEAPGSRGILVWVISNVSKRRKDAISGRTKSFYSPPFYTSCHGYKMCARIYPNGDGQARGTHLSLFFVVMKGQYDNILRWPFRQKVTFMVVDQGDRKHIVDAFNPDPTSSSFKKPTEDMNIASGCPLFAELSLLEDDNYQYVKDDCLFVKVVVDTTDLQNM